MASELYALDKIDNAIARTKSLLWPFQKGIWLRIALISLFIGGFGGFSNPFGQTMSKDDLAGMDASSFIAQYLTIIILLIVLLFVLLIIFGIISGAFQFVFVDCLRTGDVHIRKYFRDRLGKGLRYFLFTLGMLLILLAIILIPLIISIGVFSGIVDAGGAGGFAILSFLLLFLLLSLILLIPFMIIMLLTTDFVIPIMIRDDCGVLDGWRKCWPLVRGELKETAVYVVAKVIAQIGVAIAAGICVLVAGIIIAIPFLMVFFATVMVSPNMIAFIILLIAYLAVFIPVALLISVPFVTFLRYYSLEVLGCFSEEYRLLPE